MLMSGLFGEDLFDDFWGFPTHELANIDKRLYGKNARHMMETDTINAYTITKKGRRKMMYQSPWRKDGQVAGMVEISMVIPDEMPHYDRDKK